MLVRVERRPWNFFQKKLAKAIRIILRTVNTPGWLVAKRAPLALQTTTFAHQFTVAIDCCL